MSASPTPVLEVKTAVEQIGRNFEEFKSVAEKARKDGDVLLQEQIVKLAEDITTKHEAVLTQMREYEAKASRPNYGKGGEKKESGAGEFSKTRSVVQRESALFNGKFETSEAEYDAYTKAFSRYLRFDKDALLADEVKALSVGTDPSGGAWIMPAEMSGQIVQRIFEGSPVRSVASVQAIGTSEYEVPEDPNDIGGSGWVGETATRSETTTSQPSLKRIVAHELYVFPMVTNKMLQDAAIDVESYLTGKITDRLSRLEGTAFVAGTGNNQPRGFTTYANGTTWGTIQQVTTGTSGSFTYSGLINLVTAIKDKYQRNASFMIRRQSVASLMTIVDGSSRLIFQPILNGDFNKTPLLGAQINYATDMAAVGAGALALAYGDFKAGYQIVDRTGISLLRDPYSNKPYIGYYVTKRVGGDVIDFDAIKLQVLT